MSSSAYQQQKTGGESQRPPLPAKPKVSDSAQHPKPPDKTGPPPLYDLRFRTKKRLIILEVITVILIWVVVFLPPNSSGGASAVVKDSTSQTYLGLLEECTGTTCSTWMSGIGSGTSLHITLSSVYLTTGMGAVVSFYLALYGLFISLFIRSPFSNPPTEHLPPNSTLTRPHSMASCFNGTKKLVYFMSRLMLFINMWAVFGEVIACISLAVSASKASSNLSSSTSSATAAAVSTASYIGTGTYLLFFAFVLLLLSVLIDLVRWRWLTGTPNFIAKIDCCVSCLRSWRLTGGSDRDAGNKV